MSVFNHMQESFNGGEWSPLMAGRVSLAKYPNALYRLENMILDPRGPAIFRPGWRYIKGTKYNAKVSRLIPFEFSVTQAYILEFGDYYIRFYTSQAQVLSGGVAYEVVSPYAASDVAKIKYCQSADVLYLFHPSYAPRKLSRASSTSWALATINFKPSPVDEQGIKPATTLTLAALTGAGVTFTAGAATFINGDVGRVITSGVGRASIVAFVSSTQVTCDILDDFAAVGPIASQAWTMLGSTNGDVTPSIKRPTGAICTIKSTGKTETFTNLLDHPVAPNNNWIAGASGTNEYYLKNTAAFYSATQPDKVYIDGVSSIEGVPGSLGVKQWGWGDNDTLGYSTIYIRLVDGADPDTKSTNAAPDDDFIKRSASSATTDLFRSTDVGNYMEIWGGLIKITGFTSAKVITGEIIKVLSAKTETDAWVIKSAVWSAANGYPSCGTFYEDRLCCASSTVYPETVWGSAVGDYENFTPGPDDSDSFAFTISGREVSIIRWIEPDEYLLAGSVSKISRLGPTGSGQVLTPTNVNAKRQSADGAADISPVAVGNAVLYVQRTGMDDGMGLKVGELTWSWEKEKYVTPDMSLVANHVTKTGILGVAYQKEPASILWCYRTDGEVSALTYLREQDVVSWHRHPTDGDVESMATIPGDGYNELWAVIKRTINGATVRYVEMMEKIFDDSAADYLANKGLNAFFVDCGITYTGAAATVITGLSHLEGESVVGLADGSYVAPKTVTGGQITLSKAATVVHVGLPYTGIIETMRPEVPMRDGTAQGRIKAVNGGHIRVNESGPFKVGRDATHLDECHDKEMVITLGGSYPLYTGDIPFRFDGTHNRDGRIMIVQDKPLPLTVVAIMQELAM